MCINPEFRRPSGRLVRLLVILSALWGTPSLASGQALPDAPGQLAVDDVTGNYVTLTWDAPVDARPDGYVVEGGFVPDEVAGSLSVGPDTTSITLPLPSGVYFIRTYAVVEGQRSAPSNEVRVAVAMPRPPSAPENLTAGAIGHGVVISWRSTFNGGAADRVVLDFTGTITGALALPNTGSFRIAAVPDGVYAVRVRAVNDAGESTSTEPVTVSVPGPVPIVTRAPAGSPADDRLPVRFEQFAAPRLSLLREREQLDAVVAGAATEFQAILKLRDWVAAQFPHSTPDPYPPWDAMIVLDEIRAGRTGGFCAQYSQVLLQSLASLGVPARYVEIGTSRNPINHFPLEVWSNDFEKWVLIDADFILHYERDGVPMSAVEVHDAYVAGESAMVTVVEGTRAPDHPAPSDMPERTLELYYYLRYHLKADHVSQPYEAAFDRLNDTIEFLDSRTVPWELSPETSPYVDKQPLSLRGTTSRGFVDAPINGLWLTPRMSAPAEVTIDLATTMPDVAYAEYRIIGRNGDAGPWVRHAAASFVWPIASGEQGVEMRVVNSRGVSGPASAVTLVTP